MMLVSIILPVYNTPVEWLKQSINSILNQTYQEFELIIIDDCSINLETKEFLLKIKEVDNRIKLIEFDKNYGISKALNVGIQCSKSNIIFRMDSDDISYPNRIELQLNYLNENPDVDILGGLSNYLAKIGDNWGYSTKLLERPEIIDIDFALKDHWLLIHPTVVFKKDKIQKIGGYDESLKGLPEDFDLWIRCLKSNYIIRNMQEPVLTYRFNDNSLSNKFNKSASLFIHEKRKTLI